MPFFSKRRPKKRKQPTKNDADIARLMRQPYTDLLGLYQNVFPPDNNADVAIASTHAMSTDVDPDAKIELVFGDELHIPHDLLDACLNQGNYSFDDANQNIRNLAKQLKDKALLIVNLMKEHHQADAREEEQRLNDLYREYFRLSAKEQHIQLEKIKQAIQEQQAIVDQLSPQDTNFDEQKQKLQALQAKLADMQALATNHDQSTQEHSSQSAPVTANDQPLAKQDEPTEKENANSESVDDNAMNKQLNDPKTEMPAEPTATDTMHSASADASQDVATDDALTHNPPTKQPADAPTPKTDDTDKAITPKEQPQRTFDDDNDDTFAPHASAPQDDKEQTPSTDSASPKIKEEQSEIISFGTGKQRDSQQAPRHIVREDTMNGLVPKQPTTQGDDNMANDDANTNNSAHPQIDDNQTSNSQQLMQILSKLSHDDVVKIANFTAQKLPADQRQQFEYVKQLLQSNQPLPKQEQPSVPTSTHTDTLTERKSADDTPQAPLSDANDVLQVSIPYIDTIFHDVDTMIINQATLSRLKGVKIRQNVIIFAYDNDTLLKVRAYDSQVVNMGKELPTDTMMLAPSTSFTNVKQDLIAFLKAQDNVNESQWTDGNGKRYIVDK